MAASSSRARLASRGAARALLSPIGLVGGAAVAVALAVLGAPVWAAAVAGVAVWALNAWRMLPRGPRPERVDPFTLQEPWRRFVQEALQARTRFATAVERAPSGPLRDRLAEIAARVDTGVQETWLIAKRGQTLVRARRDVDLARIERQLAELSPGTAGDADRAADDIDSSVSSVVASLEAQRAAATRLDTIITRTQTELKVLDARLDEAVARTVELSARAGADVTVAGLGSDVDDLVTEMEALRLALDEADAAAGRPPPPPDLPRGGTS